MTPLHYSQFLVRPVSSAPGRRFRVHLYVEPDENSPNSSSGRIAFPWKKDPDTANAAAMGYVHKHLNEDSAFGRYMELQLTYADHG